MAEPLNDDEILADLESLRLSIEPFEFARLGRSAIDRTSLRRINLVTYLEEQGYSGIELARSCGTFGKAVKRTFVHIYGREPLELLDPIAGDLTPVAHYFEADRWLVDAAYREWARKEPAEAAEVDPDIWLSLITHFNRIDESIRTIRGLIAARQSTATTTRSTT